MDDLVEACGKVARCRQIDSDEIMSTLSQLTNREEVPMSILRNLFKHIAVVGIVAVAAALASCAQSASTPSDSAALAAKVAELEAKVALLSDREQIHEVYLHYMRGFDRNDEE